MSYPSNSIDVAGDQLDAFIQRVERLAEERKSIGDDIAEVYAEAKANGFDTKVMKVIVRERAMDPAERMERDALLDLYRRALGMIVATPAPARETKSEPEPKAQKIDEPKPGAAELVDTQSTAARMDEPMPRPGRPMQGAGTQARSVGINSEASHDHASQQAASATADAGMAQPADELRAAGHDHREPEAPDLTAVASALSGETEQSGLVSPGLSTISETNDGGSDETAVPDEVPVELDRRRQDQDDLANKDVHDDADFDHRPVIVSEEPGRSLASDTPSNVNTFKPKPFRPFCLNRNRCAGMGQNHCYSCAKAVETGGTSIDHHGSIGA